MRIARCAVCGVRGACWFSRPLCVACSASPAGPVVPEWVTALRADRETGLTYAELADKYGIDASNARKVALGLAYRGAA